ncbi:hypothetical protein CEE37_13240 [candidate division LCP-89 bacterium B3_LCP]|uniref:Uroporphyrinogen decarboxylase (URO-D) domain-containing protein n=1 Tax=candidate division LCP-89 bacterium B3_LCP TaxID=2012998 RepID=A0A532USL2_UNCL8|nr:MAG: hypothetical protein CEE37_13240 [candidate division LCP-89 bacterium B3_LCP]
MFSGEGLPPPYTGMDIWQVYDQLGCSARLYEFNSCFKRIEHSSVHVTDKPLNETDTETTIHTAVGNQTVITRKTINSPHQIVLKWEVESSDELKVATWREENATWQWDQDRFDNLQNKIGHLGAPTMFMPRMNVQCLYIEKMGVEKGVYAMYEMPEQVESFFQALEENHDRLIDVINSSPVDIINFGENIHASTLSPDLFVKYHLPACQRRCEKLHSAGKFVCSHWDGDVKALLPFVRETGLNGIEAITPEPQGDVTLMEIREALGDDMFLLDGIPAVYFDDTYPVEALIECTELLIELFAPKLVLGISDEISSTGDIERIRIVGEIVNKYNRQFE